MEKNRRKIGLSYLPSLNKIRITRKGVRETVGYLYSIEQQGGKVQGHRASMFLVQNAWLFNEKPIDGYLYYQTPMESRGETGVTPNKLSIDFRENRFYINKHWAGTFYESGDGAIYLCNWSGAGWKTIGGTKVCGKLSLR